MLLIVKVVQRTVARRRLRLEAKLVQGFWGKDAVAKTIIYSMYLAVVTTWCLLKKSHFWKVSI
jgi:hypothetical protein